MFVPMTTSAKITLSPQELQLVTNTEWILTKQVITDKVYHLLGESSVKMKVLTGNEKKWLPEKVMLTTPKIYKGENYRNFPYVMLDYPRLFGTNGIFAIRTMFWWGNFFSITIHLSGIYKNMFQKAIIKNRELLLNNKYFICINEDQWQHHFDADNYYLVSEMGKENFNNCLQEKKFIKIAIPFTLQQWEDIPELIEQSFFEIMQLLKY